MTEAQQRAKRKYLAKGKRIFIELYPSETDLIEHIEKQPNKQGYIKDLIKRDLRYRKLSAGAATVARKAADAAARAMTEEIEEQLNKDK